MISDCFLFWSTRFENCSFLSVKWKEHHALIGRGVRDELVLLPDVPLHVGLSLVLTFAKGAKEQAIMGMSQHVLCQIALAQEPME